MGRNEPPSIKKQANQPCGYCGRKEQTEKHNTCDGCGYPIKKMPTSPPPPKKTFVCPPKNPKHQ